MIVADSSAIVESLIGSAGQRLLLANEQVQVVSPTDIEVASSLRRQVHFGWLRAEEGWRLLDTYRRTPSLGIAHSPCSSVTPGSGAPGLRCGITVLPG